MEFGNNLAIESNEENLIDGDVELLDEIKDFAEEGGGLAGAGGSEGELEVLTGYDGFDLLGVERVTLDGVAFSLTALNEGAVELGATTNEATQTEAGAEVAKTGKADFEVGAMRSDEMVAAQKRLEIALGNILALKELTQFGEARGVVGGGFGHIIYIIYGGGED